MRLDEAIEILTLENKHPWNRDNSELRHAVKLGIEALQRIKDCRHDWNLTITEILPGETKEVKP